MEICRNLCDFLSAHTVKLPHVLPNPKLKCDARLLLFIPSPLSSPDLCYTSKLKFKNYSSSPQSQIGQELRFLHMDNTN